jgi:alpha-1,3-glucosyltransferase
MSEWVDYVQNIITKKFHWFQYNCISLGLAVGAAAAVIMRQELMACILFSLSLNHKQVLVMLVNYKSQSFSYRFF